MQGGEAKRESGTEGGLAWPGPSRGHRRHYGLDRLLFQFCVIPLFAGAGRRWPGPGKRSRLGWPRMARLRRGRRRRRRAPRPSRGRGPARTREEQDVKPRRPSYLEKHRSARGCRPAGAIGAFRVRVSIAGCLPWRLRALRNVPVLLHARGEKVAGISGRSGVFSRVWGGGLPTWMGDSWQVVDRGVPVVPLRAFRRGDAHGHARTHLGRARAARAGVRASVLAARSLAQRSTCQVRPCKMTRPFLFQPRLAASGAGGHT